MSQQHISHITYNIQHISHLHCSRLLLQITMSHHSQCISRGHISKANCIYNILILSCFQFGAIANQRKNIANQIYFKNWKKNNFIWNWIGVDSLHQGRLESAVTFFKRFWMSNFGCYCWPICSFWFPHIIFLSRGISFSFAPCFKHFFMGLIRLGITFGLSIVTSQFPRFPIYPGRPIASLHETNGWCEW